MADKEKPPVLGNFGTGDSLILRPAGNGGWTVTAHSASEGFVGNLVGAFSSAKDMTDALSESLG
jgi:hypothetical protein